MHLRIEEDKQTKKLERSVRRQLYKLIRINASKQKPQILISPKLMESSKKIRTKSFLEIYLEYNFSI